MMQWDHVSKTIANTEAEDVKYGKHDKVAAKTCQGLEYYEYSAANDKQESWVKFLRIISTIRNEEGIDDKNCRKNQIDILHFDVVI